MTTKIISLRIDEAQLKRIDAAATDVQTAISQATGSLPVDLPSPPTFSKTNPNDQPILYVAMTSDSVAPGRLYDYASTQVGQRISILPGVSRVNVFGTKSAIRIKALGGKNPDTMFKNLGKLIQKHGLEKLAVAACEKIEAGQKKAVFLHFLDILVSDGTVAPEEERIAVAVQQALGLDDNFVKTAYDLLQEKNKL